MQRRMSGVTLVELVTVLSIATVSIVLAAPAMGGVLSRMRANTTMHLMATDFAAARSSALMRRAPVIVCPLRGGLCGEDGDWSAGWRVFVDADGDGHADPDGVLRETVLPADTAVVLTGSRPRLRYRPDGRASHSNLTVRLCRDDRQMGEVVVNNLGRVRSARPSAARACPS